MTKLTYFFKRNSIKLIIILLLFLTVFFGYSYFKIKAEYVDLTNQMSEFENRFNLLSPTIAWMNTENFLEKQKTYTVNYWDLKEQITQEIEKYPEEIYGFYFEDLSTGGWIGVNEKQRFMPRSLFKVPLMVAVLKKVEEGEISLNQKQKITPADLDFLNGNSTLNQVGLELTVQELLTRMIQESDNVAMRTLANHFVDDEDYARTISMMGLYQTSNEQSVSPREYGNIFRSLYFSTYLRRPFSELALSILEGTKFISQLPSGLPAGVKISHKVGFDYQLGYYHDCGIVYLPKKHYLICIMSQNTTLERADEVISSISKITYDFNVNLIKENNSTSE